MQNHEYSTFSTFENRSYLAHVAELLARDAREERVLLREVHGEDRRGAVLAGHDEDHLARATGQRGRTACGPGATPSRFPDACALSYTAYEVL